MVSCEGLVIAPEVVSLCWTVEHVGENDEVEPCFEGEFLFA